MIESYHVLSTCRAHYSNGYCHEYERCLLPYSTCNEWKMEREYTTGTTNVYCQTTSGPWSTSQWLDWIELNRFAPCDQWWGTNANPFNLKPKCTSHTMGRLTSNTPKINRSQSTLDLHVINNNNNNNRLSLFSERLWITILTYH